MRIEIAWSPAPREVLSREVQLPPGSCVADALAAIGWTTTPGPLPVAGIWGRKAAASALLRDGDRVEIYRPLRVDPKVARRERFARQGARQAGLFARQRPGAKPGY